MNKIKFIYDLIGSVKQKEDIKGSFNMSGIKGGNKVFEVNNNFEKENTKEKLKSSFNQEILFDGKKLRRNFCTELEGFSQDEKKLHHSFMSHIHNGFHIHEHNEFHIHELNHENKLNKIKLLFGMLNDMEIEKDQENGYTLSLISDKVSEDVKKLLLEIINNHAKEDSNCIHNNPIHHQHHNLHENCNFGDTHDKFHDFMKQFHESKDFRFQIKMSINDNYEVKKSIMKIESHQSQMELNVNVNLA
ncbi:hypothetical protein AB8U03_15030 [Clostridium sp. Mt-5]|uniref:Uncharacterized protein n=1 Tax=Clostridium moutaii TaxID=3240932 RepID=A0ABV4BRU8_9CLOT